MKGGKRIRKNGMKGRGEGRGRGSLAWDEKEPYFPLKNNMYTKRELKILGYKIEKYLSRQQKNEKDRSKSKRNTILL